ncbi:MAG: prephenate/arogenate dehydrogenase family protein [Alphaproteobacteria bacterium]
MFNKICIIGLGLIGSSLARIIKAQNLAETLVAVDINPKVCDKVLELGIADEATTSLSMGAEGADLVILCSPTGTMALVAKGIADYLKPGAIVTDVGSVKSSVVKDLRENLPEGIEIVPGHPIAGTEYSGPEAGFVELFEGRWCILTPLPETSLLAVEKVSALWQACGAKIEIMEAQRHDLILAITSHLPHLIAYSIVDTASGLEEETKSEVIKFSASGFRGFTRIAASDPVMWRDVFLNNREAVLEILGRFTEDLSALQKAIRKGDGDYMFDVFSRTREIRRQIVELGPEGIPSPQRVGRD